MRATVSRPASIVLPIRRSSIVRKKPALARLARVARRRTSAWVYASRKYGGNLIASLG